MQNTHVASCKIITNINCLESTVERSFDHRSQLLGTAAEPPNKLDMYVLYIANLVTYVSDYPSKKQPSSHL